MNSNKSSEEIYVRPFHRNGYDLMLGILSGLGYFVYRDEFENNFFIHEDRIYFKENAVDKVELERLPNLIERNGIHISDIKIKFQFAHKLSKLNINNRVINIIRDGRDTFYAIYNDVKQGCYKTSNLTKCSMEEALNLPAFKESGALCGLGLLEEWFLYNLFLQKVIKEKCLLRIYFEDLKSTESGVHEIRKILDFINDSKTNNEISEVLKKNRRELLFPEHRINAGKIQAWKQESCPELNKRFNLLASVFDLNNKYEWERVRYTETSLPDEVLSTASELWINNIIERLKINFPVFDISQFKDSLKLICPFVEEIPLLKLYFGHELLREKKFESYGKKIVEEFLNSEIVFYNLAAMAILYKIKPNSRKIKDIRKLLFKFIDGKEEQLDFNAYPNICHRFKDFCYFIDLNDEFSKYYNAEFATTKLSYRDKLYLLRIGLQKKMRLI